MQPPVSEERLRIYADLTIKIGLNLQPRPAAADHRPARQRRRSLEAAPLVRHIAASAYQAGAQLVETLWGDEALLLRALHARAARLVRRVLGVAARRAGAARRGGARGAVDLRERSGSAEGRARRIWSARCSRRRRAASVRSASTSRATRRTGRSIAAAAPAGRRACFRICRRTEQVRALWDAIARLCRLDRRRSDRGVGDAPRRRSPRARDYLNAKQYTALQLHADPAPR